MTLEKADDSQSNYKDEWQDVFFLNLKMKWKNQFGIRFRELEDDGTFHQWKENIGCLQRTIGEGKRWEAGTRWHQTPAQVSPLKLSTAIVSPAKVSPTIVSPAKVSPL